LKLNGLIINYRCKITKKREIMATFAGGF